MHSIRDLVHCLLDSDGIPSFAIVELAQERGWISIRHANFLMNHWPTESEDFNPSSPEEKMILLKVRHDIFLEYIKYKERK